VGTLYTTSIDQMGFLPGFVAPVRATDKPALSYEGPVRGKYHREREREREITMLAVSMGRHLFQYSVVLVTTAARGYDFRASRSQHHSM